MSLIPDYESQFQRMHAASRREPPLDESGRKALLRALRQCLCDARADFFAAVSQDFGCRSAQETLFTEVLPSMLIIHNALRNLASWMRPRRRGPWSIARLSWLRRRDAHGPRWLDVNARMSVVRVELAGD